MSVVHGLCTPTFVLVLFLGALLGPNSVKADEIGKIGAEVEEIRGQGESLGPRYLKRGEFKGSQYVTERLIDGENFYRIKDYHRAAIIFMDIIENYPQSPASADALYLYADSLFLARDYLGAREWFRKVLDERGQSGLAQFREKAIERLIEIAIHLGEFEGIEQYFSQLGQTPTPEARYVKAKYLYFKGNIDQAKQEFATVVGTENKLLGLKAVYMSGVILTQQALYEEAIAMFLRGRGFEPTTNEERELVDLLNLGAGRLYHEQGFVDKASECYKEIEQNSPYFDAALYESASVLIRAGDTIRAEQTLEVLTVAVPDSRYIPRAEMLRGNLLLRAGRYDDAEKVFDEVIGEFTPVIVQLDDVISEQHDTRRFFSELVEQSLATLDVASILPPLVVKWVGEEPEVQRAMELATDLGAAKEYVKETERLIRLLEAVIDGPSRINAIPMLREGKRRSQQIGNRLGQLRGYLVRIAEEQLGDNSAEFKRLKRERRELESKLAALPTSDAEYEKREKESRFIYNRMRQELARHVIRIDQLTAMTVAIERFIGDARYQEGVSEENLETIAGEISRHRQAALKMKEELEQVRVDVDKARYQIGVGDSSDQMDDELKARIRNLAHQERRLLGNRGSKVGVRLERIHVAIDSIEGLLTRFEREIEEVAITQVEKMRNQVNVERDKVAGYHAELRILNDEAEEVVGGVAFENFSNVRKRFHDLILKADVGIIDVAWLRKEEHTSRIGELTKVRLSQIKSLDDEFQEVKTAPKSKAH